MPWSPQPGPQTALFEWNPTRHVVAPFLPPAEWPRWRAMDWGYRRPFSIGWYALRPADNRIVRYREYYGCSGSTPLPGPRQFMMSNRKFQEKSGG